MIIRSYAERIRLMGSYADLDRVIFRVPTVRCRNPYGILFRIKECEFGRFRCNNNIVPRATINKEITVHGYCISI